MSIQVLKAQVQETFGRPISTTTHCEQLADDIYNRTRLTLNYQTLRRFFGLVKYPFRPSNETLNILSQYSAKMHFADFCKHLNGDFWIKDFTNPHTTEQELWQHSQRLCEEISTLPHRLTSVHLQMMNQPQVRQFFMEHHPMRDLLGTVYTQYFTEYLKYAKSTESKLFAYSFLFMGAFLTENQELAQLYHGRLAELPSGAGYMVLPVAHRYGILLQWADLQNRNQEFDRIFEEMLKVREAYPAEMRRVVGGYEYTVLEHLIYTRRPAEMKYLMQLRAEEEAPDYYYVPESRKQTHREAWKILCAWIHWQNKEHSAAIEQLTLVQPERLDLGWKAYYQLLYHLLRGHLLQDSNSMAYLPDAIQKTRFTYLSRYLPSAVARGLCLN